MGSTRTVIDESTILPMNRLLLATMVAVALPAAAAAPACTPETLSVEGTPVTVGYCVSGPLRATASRRDRRSGRGDLLGAGTASCGAHPSCTFSPERAISRVLESLDLTQAGHDRNAAPDARLHRAGAVRVEGALLTPGAITIK